jgi:hypothetical protein
VKYIISAPCEIVTAVWLRVLVFRDVTPCRRMSGVLLFTDRGTFIFKGQPVQVALLFGTQKYVIIIIVIIIIIIE